MFKKKVVKSGETKTLSYQLSWIKSKWWYASSKELQGGHCKVCILFDDLATNAPKRNSIKNAFQNVSKSEKISEHEKKDCHNKALEKAKKFVMTFEDKTKAVTHDKYNNDKCQKNLHILKLIIEAVMLFSEQGLAFRSHREQSNYSESYHEKRVNRGSFNAIINAFAKLDTI